MTQMLSYASMAIRFTFPLVLLLKKQEPKNKDDGNRWLKVPDFESFICFEFVSNRSFLQTLDQGRIQKIRAPLLLKNPGPPLMGSYPPPYGLNPPSDHGLNSPPHGPPHP